MNCNLCNKTLIMVDVVKYKCGHVFHKFCLLPKSISILNPVCKVCNNGKMEGYPSDKEEEEEEEYENFKENENLTKSEKIILCECVLLGLSLIGVITGIIYR